MEEKGIEKKYKVMLEIDPEALDGYDFFHPDEVGSNDNGFDRCIVTYYYRKINKKHNPTMIIESIEGQDFKGRYGIISHFERNHALRYSVHIDGFYEGLSHE